MLEFNLLNCMRWTRAAWFKWYWFYLQLVFNLRALFSFLIGSLQTHEFIKRTISWSYKVLSKRLETNYFVNVSYISYFFSNIDLSKANQLIKKKDNNFQITVIDYEYTTVSWIALKIVVLGVTDFTFTCSCIAWNLLLRQFL